MCQGYAPGEEIPGVGLCALDFVSKEFFGPGIVSSSANGEVNSANNLGYTDDLSKWGYAYAFFLHNSGSARSLALTLNTCNDVMIYRFDGAARASHSAATGSLLYHRTPGTADGGESCPCSNLSPSITIPGGDSRLVFLTTRQRLHFQPCHYPGGWTRTTD